MGHSMAQVQKVQKVQRVQRVAADAADYKKKGARLAQPDRGYICRRQIIQQTVYQAIRHRKPIP
mgnify:CR=1 FL=1